MFAAQRGCVRLLRSSFPVCRRTVTPCPRCLHTSRSLGSSGGAEEDVGRPLRRWTVGLSPFSTVRAQLSCSISVRPLDPHAFPGADRTFVSVHGTGTEQEADVAELQVLYDEPSQELLISAEKVKSSLSVEVEAPIKSNLFITTHGNGNVQVKKMECDVCRVQTEKGNCLLHSVKGHRVEVRSHGGDITGVGTIHGNVDISTHGDGAVSVKKLQGTAMKVTTERGPLKVRAIYAESSSVVSSSGKVEVGHVHGSASVANGSGDTLIDGSNRFVQVSSHSGSIDVYVGEGASAELHSQEGAVCVRVPSSLRAVVELCGATVDVSPQVRLHGLTQHTTESQTTVTGYMNSVGPVEQQIKAQADGAAVRLQTQSWFESLKLGG